jgi:large subunit ribosomal protein L9
MKVLFLEDVRPTARAGEIKEVKNGFARNYLIPKKLAVLATKHEVERAEGLRKDAESRRRKEAADWRDVVDGIKEKTLTVIVRTGPTGRLYGSVTPAMIATEIEAAAGREIDRRGIRIPAPIRTTGKFGIPVQFADGVVATLDVIIEPDADSKGRIAAAKKAAAEGGAPVGETEASPDATFDEVLRRAEAEIAAIGKAGNGAEAESEEK